MTSEQASLVRITAFTSILWVPYILNRVLVGRGVWWEMGYPDKATVLSPWAQRLQKAHLNAIENLAIFAPLVLVAGATGISAPATVLAATVFVWARIAHAISYVFAIPVLRTLAFNFGWGCNAVLAWALLFR